MEGLGDRLTQIRITRGETQLQVAQALEITDRYLSLIENGRNIPALDTLEKIANYYHISMSDLFADIGEPTRPALALSLEALQARGINAQDIADLNRIEFRGRRLQSEEDWLTLYLFLELLFCRRERRR